MNATLAFAHRHVFVLLLAVVSLALNACAPRVDVASSSSRQQEIVGGFDSAITNHPWQVTLQSGGHFCGGALVASTWVVTANHCLEEIQANWIEVVAGVTFLSDVDSGESAGVTQIVRFPGFSNPGAGRDIAMLQLSSPMAMSASVQAIRVVTSADVTAGEIDVGQIGNASGWGATTSGGFDTPNGLRAVDVPIRSLSDAEEYYGPITDDQIAAGGENGDTCQGDSGGPMTVETQNGPTLVGVTSWGGGCNEGSPGMYTRVASYATWIADTMAGNPGEGEGEGEWQCDPSWQGDSECDCGCGAEDPDCPNAQASECLYDHCESLNGPGSTINPNDPTQCGTDGPQCPPNASPIGAECQCDPGFVPNASGTACVLDSGEGGEGEGEGEVGEGEGEAGPTRDDDDDSDSDDEEPPSCAAGLGTPLVAVLALMLRRRRRDR